MTQKPLTVFRISAFRQPHPSGTCPGDWSQDATCTTAPLTTRNPCVPQHHGCIWGWWDLAQEVHGSSKFRRPNSLALQRRPKMPHSILCNSWPTLSSSNAWECKSWWDSLSRFFFSREKERAEGASTSPLASVWSQIWLPSNSCGGFGMCERAPNQCGGWRIWGFLRVAPPSALATSRHRIHLYQSHEAGFKSCIL